MLNLLAITKSPSLSNTLNSVTFKDVLRFLNYNTILTFAPKELQHQYFFIYYKGNIEDPKNKIDFENQILHHLHLNKKVKKEYFYSYTLFPNVATLFKSFKKENTLQKHIWYNNGIWNNTLKVTYLK